jgi:hypothetical protein
VPRRRASRGDRSHGTSVRPVPPAAPAFVEDPAEDPAEDPVEEPLDRPVEQPLEQPLEQPVEPAEEPERVREEVVPGPTAAEMRVKVSAGHETRHPWWATTLWGLVVAGGLACLVAALLPVGPPWLDGVGAVTIVTTYSFGLAARTGGRPVVFGGLALLLGAGVLLADESYLRTGAAVLTCAVAAVLAVMVTVPGEHFARVARECCLAVLVAAVGALAVVGFDPVLALARFEYVTLGLSLVGVLVLVYRLGAGWHGLGSRGIVGVLVGGAILAGLLLYAELLRRYGPPDLVTSLLDGVRWSRENLGAFPRPIEAALGVPALAWGVHMRARRRQGWWLCAFGAAGTTAVANSLVNPAISLRECGLSVGYGLVVGLLIGYAVIRADVALTGASGRGRRAGGPATAVRPEPPRSAALL